MLSDASVRKDRDRLPALYAAAGVPELWHADARGVEPVLEIHRLTGSLYEPVGSREGWAESPCLGVSVRLQRDEDPSGLWFFELAVR